MYEFTKSETSKVLNSIDPKGRSLKSKLQMDIYPKNYNLEHVRIITKLLLNGGTYIPIDNYLYIYIFSLY